jgi:hypothetical protein
MRDFVKSRSGTARSISIVERQQTCEHPPGSILPGVLCALVVASCAPAYTRTSIVLPPEMRSTGALRPARIPPPVKTAVPLPKQELLRPQPEPDCTFPATDTAADERQKLDYERQCYRHAEMIARTRLQLLQDSVAKTFTAVKSTD